MTDTSPTESNAGGPTISEQDFTPDLTLDNNLMDLMKLIDPCEDPMEKYRGMTVAPSSPTYQLDDIEARGEGTPWDDSIPSSYYNRDNGADKPEGGSTLIVGVDMPGNDVRHTHNNDRGTMWASKPAQKRRNTGTHFSSRPSGRRTPEQGAGQRNKTNSHLSNDVMRCLRKERHPVPERRMVRWFPDCDVLNILQNCQNVRFARDREGVRTWVYDPDHVIKDDIMAAIRDGCSSMEEIQSRVHRRFRVVRGALYELERSRRVTGYETDGQKSWVERSRAISKD
jgi:hypothetical protein